LFAYRAIAAGAWKHLKENGIIILEIGAGQQSDVSEIFGSHEFQPFGQKQDLGGHVRALAFKLRD
jgi:release factor glutamine methyltransferase